MLVNALTEFFWTSLNNESMIGRLELHSAGHYIINEGKEKAI